MANDYDFIDEFIKQSLDTYNKQLFGNYDDNTGYFEESIPENDTLNDTVNDTEDVQDTSNETGEEDMYSSVYPDENTDTNIGGISPYIGGAHPGGNLSSQISAKESQGNYNAFNPAGGGEGAVGKYQFRWGQWKDSIMHVTGVKSKEQFRKNPAAQEKYFEWFKQNQLLPGVQRIKRQGLNKQGLSDDQLAKLVHFRGEQGAIDYLKGKVSDKPEVYNTAISKYIKQAGGTPIARTKQQQYIGLNDNSIDELILPLDGENTIRGLDSGEPVYIEDNFGNNNILYGPNHKVKMRGRVFEKRLKK